MKKLSLGFALIQTIIAIVILATALSGAVVLMGTVITETAFNKNRIVALYLAQECLELARNARDSAWKQNLPWDCSFPEKDKSYRIWSTPESLPGGGTTSCQNQLGLQIDAPHPPFNLSLENNTIFHETPWNPSSGKGMIFQRRLTLSDILYKNNDPLASPKQMTITCTISWPQRGDDGEISMSEVLTNWYKK